MAPKSADLEYEVVDAESLTLAKGSNATIAPSTSVAQTHPLPAEQPAASPGRATSLITIASEASKGEAKSVAAEKVGNAPLALSPTAPFSPLALVLLADIEASGDAIDPEALPLVRHAVRNCSAAELAALRINLLQVRQGDEKAALWLPTETEGGDESDEGSENGSNNSEAATKLVSPKMSPHGGRKVIYFINLRDAPVDCVWIDYKGCEYNGPKADGDTTICRPWRVLPGRHLKINSAPGHLFRIYESSSFLGKRSWLGGLEVGAPMALEEEVISLSGQLPAAVGPLARNIDKLNYQLFVIT